MNAVLLPTGKVLTLAGSANDRVEDSAALDAQMFDPVTRTWADAGRMSFAHLDHSVALLLPDATVWVAGSNPYQRVVERRMEIYAPPYLFARSSSGAVVPAPRPAITR